MAINLQKGQTIDLRKNDKGENIYDLSSVTMGLGWDVRKKKTSFLGGLFGGGKEEEYDLDAIAFLLDSNNKVTNRGNEKLIGGDVVFFNSLRHNSGHIWLTGDNRTGAGDGDDEQIIVKLDSLDSKYQKIVFVVSIYKGRINNQHFGMIDNAFIRAVDNKGKEIAKFSLSGDAAYNGMCSMVFAELYRKDNSWKFRAIGEPYVSDSFVEILKQYI
jgi:tellurium resistance protein TerD